MGYRRINLRVFPYYVPYIVRSETLWVLAIAYAGRKPLYWIAAEPGWWGTLKDDPQRNAI